MRVNLSLVFVFFAALFSSDELNGQIRFTLQNQKYKAGIQTRSTIPGGIADVNGDLLDDLIILDRGRHLMVGINNGNGQPYSFMPAMTVAQDPEWTLTGGDLTNSGVFTVISSGGLGVINLSSVSADIRLEGRMFQSVYAQGSNVVDINNDGFLDYFVCDDTGPSRIFINDQSGNLVRTPVIDFTTIPESDMSGNYGSEWVDVNNDMLPDLIIAKCRAGVTDPKDPRRINVLYLNNGDGSFSEKGREFGLDSGEQSWVVTFADIDNDGDLDAFEANHYGPHRLLENIQGQRFEPLPFMPQPLSSFAFQAVMRDFDNDGFVDIAVSGVEGLYFLHNNRDKTFRKIDGPANFRSISSLTVGDINDDGFLDIHAFHPNPINILGLVDDDVLINTGNGNHFIKFNLEGIQSNRSAVGARILLYSPLGVQTRYIKGGESYGILNSFQQHFGLGVHPVADSVVVLWPSGQRHVFSHLAANHTYLIREDGCITPHTILYNAPIDHYNEEVQIQAPAGFATYQWSDGSTEPSLTVNTPGTYRLTMTDSGGCRTIVKPIQVVNRCFTPGQKLIPLPRELEVCGTSEFLLSAVNARNYNWSTGDTTRAISVNQSGLYMLLANDGCGNTLRDSIRITIINFQYTVTNDSILPGESATLRTDAEETFWYDTPEAVVQIATGNSFETGPLVQTTDYYAVLRFLLSSVTGTLGEKTFPTGNEYSGNGVAGNMVFNVLQECIIRNVTVKTDRAGRRRIIIRNAENEVVFSKEFDIPAGTHRLALNARLLPGDNYAMETDAEFNLREFGFRSPRLVRTFQGTKYPYTIPGAITLTGSSTGPSYYYYFYDWEVTHSIQYCFSQPVRVTAFVDSSSATVDMEDDTQPVLFPNPANDKIYIIKSLNYRSGIMSICDMTGKIIYQSQELPGEMDISTWTPGVYFLHIRNMHRNITLKFVKL
ncbi:MAG: VCBS repeat-containing protein [Saprospiraceae bacterium]|nr:VCBS repeat-containing protein [Saprospiraceae bacterium]